MKRVLMVLSIAVASSAHAGPLQEDQQAYTVCLRQAALALLADAVDPAPVLVEAADGDCDTERAMITAAYIGRMGATDGREAMTQFRKGLASDVIRALVRRRAGLK